MGAVFMVSKRFMLVALVEGDGPCSTVLSPSLVDDRLDDEDVDVGELMGSRQRCRTSKGEDALIALGEDAEVVVVAVAPSWVCLSRGLLMFS